jgi:hypothetical protein
MEDEVITTATSQADERLKVGAGSLRNKKKNIVKSIIKKHKNHGNKR